MCSRMLSLATLLLFASSCLRPADEPAAPAPLSAEGREAQSKKLWDEVKRLDQKGKLSEAIAVAEKMLAADRQLFGNEHANIAIVLGWLAERYEKLEKFDERSDW